ncbi:MBL fold metallo-hydrolase [Methanobacterium aggregans]|uniref:MBL fold metallo-hydrolase n=1 Tax=Methanobacterium aggregans TaxID=1615586 RepID=UPI001AE7B55F|nr:MBL fold metallo-hydrolase [Methanobacterium aggregans]MBP2046178.1 ribonuclease J [Methanobacterium aggregans]
MVGIDFYGGVDEIGGNKILIHEAQTSILLDFGMSFNQAGLYFSEFLQPRKANGINDFMELGLLPEIKGIYREDYLKHCGMECSEEPAVDGLLLSHAHMDHSAYIHHLREDIPLYMSEESHLILKVLEETSTVSFADILQVKKDFHFVPKKNGEGYKKLGGKDASLEREIKTFEPYKTFEIGDFRIRSAPVDHSLPGAAAYILESDEEVTVYSGDLRFHGRHPEITQKFVKEAKKSNPNVMLCEGTRMAEERTETEKDIEHKAKELIRDFKGPVIVNFPVRDLDRLLTFHNVAKAAGRILVVNLKQAYMLNLFKGRGYPEIEDVAVYVPRRAWGLLGEDSFACFNGQWIQSSEIEPSYVNSQYKKWERDFLDWENTVNYMDIRGEPEKYLFRCDYFELKELIDIKPENGLYIKSMTEPFDDEMMFSERRVKNWLQHFNLCPMHKMHVSGHASGPELLDMIREIEPETLYPIHTEHKEMFKVLENDGIKVVYPERAG